MPRIHPLRLISLAAIASAAAALALGPATAQDGDEPPIVHESDAGDPYVPRPAVFGPAGGAVAGVSASVQVNLDNGGLDVIGDAANEPSIAVDPTAPNRMVAGWRQFDSITSSFRQAGYSITCDGGRTWSDLQIIEPGVFRTDPVLAADREGTFFYSSLQVTGGVFTCQLFISEDHGATWPVVTEAFGGDKQWIVIDDTGSIGDGQAYQAWNTAGNQFFPNQFNRSIDTQAGWGLPVEYDPDGEPAARPVFGIVDVGPDGEVYVAGSRNSSNADQFWVVRSDSAADRFQPIVFEQIVEVNMGGNLRIGQPPNPAGLLGQVNIRVDRGNGPFHGNVYVLASVDPPGPDPMNVHLIRSEDGGLTWTDPIVVNPDPDGDDSWQWFGTMGLAPDGRLDVVWNDTSGTGQANLSELRYAFSDDAGETWSTPQTLSPVFDSHLGWPSQNKLGDYYDIESDDVGADLIWAATFNGGQDVYYLRIGDRDCNRNGIGDGEDLDQGTSADCNENDIPDECEIAAGALDDTDGDGIPDVCDTVCQADIDGSGVVDVSDLAAVIFAWGACPGCPEDLDGDGSVGVGDLAAIIVAWGPCP